MNSLIFSNSTGEILSNPQEEKREQGRVSRTHIDRTEGSDQKREE